MIHVSCAEDGMEPVTWVLRIADEILTFLAEAALENEQIGKGDGSNGYCTETEERRERHRGEMKSIKICASWVWTSDKPGSPRGEFKDDTEVPGQSVDLEHVAQKSSGRPPKDWEQILMDDFCHQQVSASVFGQTRVDKYPSMTSEKEADCYSMGKAVQG